MNLMEGTAHGKAELDVGSKADPSVFARLSLPTIDEHELSLIESARIRRAKLPFRPRSSVLRAADILLSIVMIVFFAPVMLLVAIAIKIFDPGPALFVHQRVGKDGKEFGCLKFRTMRVNADKLLDELLRLSPELQDAWTRSHKLEDDPRVSKLGKFLRVSSLDELPQLFNVLRGDMSLVGPRPITTSELAFYGRYAGHYLSVRPGLTGLWQVTGRSETTYRRRVAADVTYVRRQCVALDAYILIATVPAVIFAKGSI
ncbi:sugar transferase [Tsuneonella mangrovi]|uniref:sugar transferase n=1 Tax=Tsuneonella mangrovi TaxID=1982042 RepID=UPI001F0A7E26|nr:sugar transferase [Tsuneonella mangrovi]